MNICIIGGGNIGTLLAGELSLKENTNITLYTSKPELWNKNIIIYDTKNGNELIGSIDNITNDLKTAVMDANMVIITFPSFLIKGIIEKLSQYIKDGTYIGVMPGKGGVEFLSQNLLSKKCVFFGAQRVHSIARIKEYGKSVSMTGRKEEMYISAIPNGKTKELSLILEELLDMKIIALNNYLEVTLTPSNPILHTARLYAMFKDFNVDTISKRILFYEEWDDLSSEVLLACDKELQMLCNELKPLELSDVKSLAIHYESNTPEKMTNKIKNIDAFKNIYAPQKSVEGGYIIDTESRYFKEDFPYGLCIIKGFAEICNLKVPNIDKVLKWYEKLVGVEYITETGFNGKDICNTGAPQNYGFNCKEDIIKYYQV